MHWTSILKREYDNTTREYKENPFKLIDDFTTTANYISKSYAERMKNIVDEIKILREDILKQRSPREIAKRTKNIEMLMKDFNEEFESLNKNFNAINKLIQMG